MKYCPHWHACLIAMVVTLPAGAMAADARTAEPDPLVPLTNFGHFAARGRTHAEVEKQLRPPDYRLTPDLWVYWDCESTNVDDAARGYNTMIVSFENGRVKSIRLAPRAWVKALIARLEARQRAARANSSSSVAQR